jgi:hypothetical protein
MDQSFARKAQQEPEGEMEETEIAAEAEALAIGRDPRLRDLCLGDNVEGG